jgi:tetratricopeptide (TPR) repeat protein
LTHITRLAYILRQTTAGSDLGHGRKIAGWSWKLLRANRTLLIAVLCLALTVVTLGLARAADTYKVRVGKGLKKEAAESLRNELKKEGYLPVELNQTGDTFTVLVGAASSKAEAQGLVKDLKSAGFTVEDIEEPGAASLAGAASQQPGVAAQGDSGASKGGDVVYRVLVQDFQSQQQADEGKQSLRNEGFTNIDVVQEDGKYKLYMGTFNKQADAQAPLDQLKKAGFAFAQIASVQRAADKPAAAPPPSLPALIAALPEGQKQKGEEIVKKVQAVEKGTGSGQDYLDIKDASKDENVKKLLAEYEKQRGESAEMANKVWALYRQFDSNMQARRYDAARRNLDEVRAINPKEGALPSKQQQLDRQIASAPAVGPSATTPAAIPGAAPATGGAPPAGAKVDQAQVVAALAEARKTELTGNNPAQALALYNKVLQLDPTNVEAKGKVVELNGKINQPAQAAAASSNQKLIYGGIGALVLVILGLVYWQLVNSRREKKLEEQVRQLSQGGGATASPSATPVGGSALDTFVDPLAPGGMYSGASAPVGAGMSGMAAAAAAGNSGSGMLSSGMAMPPMSVIGGAEDEEEELEEESNPQPAVAAGPTADEQVESNEMVSLGGLNFDMLSPSAEETTPASNPNATPEPVLPPPGSDSLSLGDLDLGFGNTPAPPSMPAAEPTPAGGAASMSLPDLDLDALLKGTFPGAGSSTAAADNKPTARIEDISPMQLPDLNELGVNTEEKSIHDEVTMREMNVAVGGLGTSPTVQIPTPFPGGSGGSSASPSAPAPAAPAPASVSGVHYEQTFDDETVGSQPAAWKGDYDYASLTVDDQNGVDGTGRCLKFEKRSGAGSASYHCNFPNAAGQVTVEFDIRCDDKNKYLLGFYVEKDEDFKQSVHTIVHRIDSRSQPSLRIQGEPVPYELGTWRHVRYELNLLIGVVNAYVNDEHVVKDAKLPTIPAYVNTLSIRDNLATTGLLYLDNIRISRK